MSRVLFSVWFRIQRIIQKCPGYYSATGSGFGIFPVSTSLKKLRSPEDSQLQWRSSSRKVPGVQNRPLVNTKKRLFAFYSKIKQVRNCSELTTHTNIFKRSSAPGLNIAQVAWKPRACRHQACTGSIALKQRGSSRSPKSPPK